MESYEDMVQYARDCTRYAQTARSREVAEELQRLAREYQEKAAKMNGNKLPNIQGNTGDGAAGSPQSQVPALDRMNSEITPRPFSALLSLGKHGFMTFWYSHVKMLNSLWPSITVDGKRLVIAPNVYKPLENEHACSEYCREGDRVLDIGCGSGVGAVFCAPKAREVVAVDISAAAVRNTEENCRIHGLKNVKVMQSDMFARVEGKYDLILANSPYLEDEFQADDQQFATLVKYMPTLFAEVGDYLADGGRLLIQFPLGSRPRIEKLASEHGLEVVSIRRLPRKSLALFLLSALYLQVGFKSTLYLLQRRPAQSLSANRSAGAESTSLAAA